MNELILKYQNRLFKAWGFFAIPLTIFSAIDTIKIEDQAFGLLEEIDFIFNIDFFTEYSYFTNFIRIALYLLMIFLWYCFAIIIQSDKE